MSKVYIDNYGDKWIKISKYHVQRVKDGNIGIWDNGKGLTPTNKPTTKSKELS